MNQNVQMSVVSMASELVQKKLKILWSKGEFAVTWELKAGLLNTLFVFSGRVNYERTICSFLLRTFDVPSTFKQPDYKFYGVFFLLFRLTAALTSFTF